MSDQFFLPGEKIKYKDIQHFIGNTGVINITYNRIVQNERSISSYDVFYRIVYRQETFVFENGLLIDHIIGGNLYTGWLQTQKGQAPACACACACCSSISSC